jgi:hypothetical protein
MYIQPERETGSSADHGVGTEDHILLALVPEAGECEFHVVYGVRGCMERLRLYNPSLMDNDNMHVSAAICQQSCPHTAEWFLEACSGFE